MLTPPGILVECGDEDCFSLMDGAEYLHRVLWDLGVSHDYHLVRGADHVGPRMADRQAGILLFVGHALKRAHGRAGSDGDPPLRGAAFALALAVP